MQKKTIVIISLLSAIFSLIYVLLNYYGLIRYFSLHIFPTERYIKNYQNLDKIGNNRTIISLTVTPEQMMKLTPTITSLLDQTVKVDQISITVPYGDQYRLPYKIKNDVSVFRCGKDQGILNCLIPVIMRETESTTHIITLAGDKIYGKDFIEELLETSEKHPDKIIYENNKKTIDLNKGVVFSTKFFNEDFLDIPKGMDSNRWVNDYFETHSKKKIRYKYNYGRL